MKASKRDLMVLARNENQTEADLQHEIDLLNQLLFQVESMDHFCKANEIVDINRFKIIRKPGRIEKLLNNGSLKAFQFVCNKN